MSDLESIEDILMRRDGLSLEDAQIQIEIARGLIILGEDPEDVLREELGLEPDYIYQLIE